MRTYVTRLVLIALAGFAGVVAVASAASSGGPVKDAKYSGSTGPGYPLSFRVSANGRDVEHLVVAFEATCGVGAGDVAPKYDFTTLTIVDGKFRGSSGDSSDSVSNDLRIDGRFDGRKVTGSVTDTLHIKSLPSCTQTEPFTATAK